MGKTGGVTGTWLIVTTLNKTSSFILFNENLSNEGFMDV